ncbi:hypothetical protein QQ045_008668 [Rhodiola kirilowii]
MPHLYSCHSQCYVNGVKFVVWERGQKKRMQNSGVMVEDGELTYYGIIRNIIQLQYANGMSVFVFDCTWFNTDPKERGSTKRDYGLLSIDTSTAWYEDWPYCLATTARQVFYLDDLKAGDNWKVVNVVSHRGLYSDSSLAREDENVMCDTFLPIEEDDPYQEQMPTNITSDVQSTTQYSIEEHINQHIPRARRQTERSRAILHAMAEEEGSSRRLKKLDVIKTPPLPKTTNKVLVPIATPTRKKKKDCPSVVV